MELTKEKVDELIDALEAHSETMDRFISVLEQHTDALEYSTSSFDKMGESIKGLANELYYSGIKSLAEEIREIRKIADKREE